MWVYMIRSEMSPERTYVGSTSNLERRLAEHNTGKSSATYKFRPWVCEVKLWFADQGRAERFEKYLKSGSGRAFSRRHFWG